MALQAPATELEEPFQVVLSPGEHLGETQSLRYARQILLALAVTIPCLACI